MPPGRACTSRPRNGTERLVGATLAAVDAVAIMIAFLFSLGVRHDTWSWAPALVLAALLPAWILSMKAAGLYDKDSDVLGHSTIDELPQLARIATIGSWAYLLLLWAVTDSRGLDETAVLWGSLLVLLPLLRIVIRPAIRATDGFDQNTLIVGAGSVGQLIGRKLLTHPEYHINLLGFVDAHAEGAPRRISTTLTAPRRPGGHAAIVEALRRRARDHRVLERPARARRSSLIRALKDMDVQIDIVPRLFDIIPPRSAMPHDRGPPADRAAAACGSRRSSRFLKRAFDLVRRDRAARVLLAPLLLLIALLIKLDSPRPGVLPAGAHGQRATAVPDLQVPDDGRRRRRAEARGRAPERARATGGDPRMFKIAERPAHHARRPRCCAATRSTSCRSSSTSLSGEMSLVGPRPLILDEDQPRRRLGAHAGSTLKPGHDRALAGARPRATSRSRRWSSSTTCT